jgi:hypothetical protein
MKISSISILYTTESISLNSVTSILGSQDRRLTGKLIGIYSYSVYKKNLNPFEFKLAVTYCSNLTALIALN